MRAPETTKSGRKAKQPYNPLRHAVRSIAAGHNIKRSQPQSADSAERGVNTKNPLRDAVRAIQGKKPYVAPSAKKSTASSSRPTPTLPAKNRGPTPTAIARAQARRNKNSGPGGDGNAASNNKGGSGKGGKGGKGGAGGGGGKGGAGGNKTPTGAVFDPFAARAGHEAEEEYDPLIRELRRLKDETTRQGTTGEAQLASMFAGLAKSGEQAKTDIGNIATGAQADTDARLATLKSGIQGTYDTQNTADAASLAKLGLSGTGARGDVARGSELANNLATASTQSQNMADYTKILGMGAQGTAGLMAQGARNEGVYRQADLQNEINAALRETQGKIGDVQMQKGKAVVNLTEKYKQEGFTNQLSREQLGLEKYKAGADVANQTNQQKQDALKALLDQQGKAASAAADKLKNADSITKLTATLTQLKKPGETEGDYWSILNALSKRPRVISGRGKNPKSALTPAAAGQLAVRINNSQPKGQRVDNTILRQIAMQYYQGISK